MGINSQKRLAFFLPGLYGGGAERTVLNLAHGVAGQGYAVDLVLAQAEGPYLADVSESVRLVILNARHHKARRTLISLPALVRYLQRERPMAVLSALNRANIAVVLARRMAAVSTRLVVSHRNTLSHSSGMLMRHLIGHVYPLADGIVAVSNGVADDLAQVTGIPREGIETIYNPVVTPELRRKAQAPLDHTWFQPGQPPVLLAVGSLTEQKDFPTLIHAFARVRKKLPARLLILGEGRERPMLEALVRQLGLEQDINLPGWVENPYPYMVQASLFVLSSKWEGLPGVLIEALYCGVPLIATDCPSGPREILADGCYGHLVPVGDTDVLARTIKASLTSETPRPPRESWQPFELETVVNQYINALLVS